MIEPFSSSQVSQGTISYGLSSYGYDLRVADEFKIFAPPPDVTINPKSIPSEFYRDHKGPHCDIPANSYILARTLEYLRIPRDVLDLMCGEVDICRSGVLINVTPFEPEWEGFVTVSIANTTSRPVRVFCQTKDFARFCFFSQMMPCEVSYKDRKGKYDVQRKIEFGKTK